MTRIPIRFNEAQVELVRALARQKGVSVAEVIRRAFDIMVRSAAFPDQANQRRRAIAAIGRFASGHPDISDHHNRYLAEDL
jgi:hypothetical protein